VPAEWVAGGGLLPGLPASVPLGLPRIPGSFHLRRRGLGILLGRTCGSPGLARPAAPGAQHDGRAARPRSWVPRPSGPGPVLRRRWQCGRARRRPGPGRRRR